MWSSLFGSATPVATPEQTIPATPVATPEQTNPYDVAYMNKQKQVLHDYIKEHADTLKDCCVFVFTGQTTSYTIYPSITEAMSSPEYSDNYHVYRSDKMNAKYTLMFNQYVNEHIHELYNGDTLVFTDLNKQPIIYNHAFWVTREQLGEGHWFLYDESKWSKQWLMYQRYVKEYADELEDNTVIVYNDHNTTTPEVYPGGKGFDDTKSYSACFIYNKPSEQVVDTKSYSGYFMSSEWLMYQRYIKDHADELEHNTVIVYNDNNSAPEVFPGGKGFDDTKSYSACFIYNKPTEQKHSEQVVAKNWLKFQAYIKDHADELTDRTVFIYPDEHSEPIIAKSFEVDFEKHVQNSVGGIFFYKKPIPGAPTMDDVDIEVGKLIVGLQTAREKLEAIQNKLSAVLN